MTSLGVIRVKWLSGLDEWVPRRGETKKDRLSLVAECRIRMEQIRGKFDKANLQKNQFQKYCSLIIMQIICFMKILIGFIEVFGNITDEFAANRVTVD